MSGQEGNMQRKTLTTGKLRKRKTARKESWIVVVQTEPEAVNASNARKDDAKSKKAKRNEKSRRKNNKSSKYKQTHG